MMEVDMATPFAMIPVPERSSDKPRTRGLTMMMDWGLPLGMQRDWLQMIHPYVDLAKLVVGTAKLYEEDYLREKLELYQTHAIRPFLGGQFLEFVVNAQGIGGASAFCEEAKRLGIAAIEVSDNVVPLSDVERRELIRIATESGLEVHGEVGSKSDRSDPAELIVQAELCLNAGADVVLVEAAELMHQGKPDVTLIDALKTGLDLDHVVFELGGPWLKGVTQTDNYQLKVFLINTFGPDINLANIMPDAIWETEAARLGLSVTGPLQRNSVS
jgi:phosphosulfolactate synthase